MTKLNIRSYDIKGKTNDDVLSIITRFPFYMDDKIANRKKRMRWVFNPEHICGEGASKIYITDDIIIGVQLHEEMGDKYMLHSLERELSFVDVYEFPFEESHRIIDFMQNIIDKAPLLFHWQNKNPKHAKYTHPFFRNVLGLKNTNFMMHPKDVGLEFPYQHPQFKHVKQDILIIENMYFKKSHLIAYKVFNRLTYSSNIVWSMDFYNYLDALEPYNHSN